MSALIKRLAFFLLLAFHLVVLSAITLSDPPTPHSVSGTIYHSDGATQVPLGTNYLVNDTNTGDFVNGQTDIPIPGLSGVYFTVISGSDGDTVHVWAWNSTAYGNTSATLMGDMYGVDVYLNRTRNGETNVTILSPENNTAYDAGEYFGLTANVSAIIANGSYCNATISFSDPLVLSLPPTETATHQLGNISLGGFNSTTWNVSASGVGSSNITVSAACLNQTVILEKADRDIVSNVTVVDIMSPVVRLMSPENNTLSRTNSLTFTYNVSEASDLLNCSLIINGKVNTSNSTEVQKDTPQTFFATLENGFYNWSVNCTDAFSNTGSSDTYNLTVNVSGIEMSGLAITSPVILNSASTATVFCNATVSSGNETTSITLVNATFFDSSAAFSDSGDDNNDHYTNASCANISQAGDSKVYACSFAVWYYANSASWTCNLTATDTENNTASLAGAATVNELVSLGLNETIINYGRLNISNTSDIANITAYNFGNTDLNLSMRGFGISDGDGLAVSCELETNISVGYERYSVNPTADYDNMVNLTSTGEIVANFTLMQRTDDLQHTSDVNSTYWRIRIPTTVAGRCNGTIIVQAIASE